MLTPLLLSAPLGASWLDTVIGWFHDPETLLVAMGPWVLWGTLLIVFIESGVLFPVLPGDSLLFTAGLLHERLGLHLPTLIALTFVAAFLGAQVGYWLGWRYGRRLFTDDARFLRTEHLDKAEQYFRRYGGRSLLIGRFIPFVRTFIPLAAGIARYPYAKFLAFNSLGSLLWGVGITFAGSALGGVQFVHDNLSILILLIVLVSLVPMVVEVLLQRRRARLEAATGQPAAGGPVGTATVGTATGGADVEPTLGEVAEEVVEGVVRGVTADVLEAGAQVGDPHPGPDGARARARAVPDDDPAGPDRARRDPDAAE